MNEYITAKTWVIISLINLGKPVQRDSAVLFTMNLEMVSSFSAFYNGYMCINTIRNKQILVKMTLSCEI